MEETFTKAIDILYTGEASMTLKSLLNGDQLQIKIRGDKTIDNSLLEEIRANKKSLIDYLGNDALEIGHY